MEARKISVRGRAIVIDVEPLASIDPKDKGVVPLLKPNMEFSKPREKKLMKDVMKITRTSRRLAGIRLPTSGDSSSAGLGQGAQGPKGTEKVEVVEVVYASC